jgi:hypothetical protein
MKTLRFHVTILACWALLVKFFPAEPTAQTTEPKTKATAVHIPSGEKQSSQIEVEKPQPAENASGGMPGSGNLSVPKEGATAEGGPPTEFRRDGTKIRESNVLQQKHKNTPTVFQSNSGTAPRAFGKNQRKFALENPADKRQLEVDGHSELGKGFPTPQKIHSSPHLSPQVGSLSLNPSTLKGTGTPGLVVLGGPANAGATKDTAALAGAKSRRKNQ